MTDVELVMPIFVACPRFRRRFGIRVPTDRGGIEKPFIRWGRPAAMRSMRNGPRIQDRRLFSYGEFGHLGISVKHRAEGGLQRTQPGIVGAPAVDAFLENGAPHLFVAE